MRIRWRQTSWVILVLPTTHIPSLTKIAHCVLIRERRFTFWCWRDLTSVHTYIHQYIQTALQLKTKWSFQHSWRPTKTIFRFGLYTKSNIFKGKGTDAYWIKLCLHPCYKTKTSILPCNYWSPDSFLASCSRSHHKVARIWLRAFWE